MTAPAKDDTAPQTRLCPETSLKFLNVNRRTPMLSSVKDVNASMHMLILGDQSTTFIDATHLTHEELDIPFEMEDIRAQIQGANNVSESLFNIKSLNNPIVVVQLPSKISPELQEILLTKISYKIPTILVPANIKSTYKLQGKVVVLPEVMIKPDLQSPTVVNWDALVRITRYLDEFEGWSELHNSEPVGRISLPVPGKALVKIEVE
ncbi:hypothetical protein NVP2275O_101 [Vibrio phage 2.275.O._10N.286.54.E11]|nr:hypothetical protein NVP2275O_101 [Vibrio phage 2.275.O._10N.286.54.E11]